MSKPKNRLNKITPILMNHFLITFSSYPNRRSPMGCICSTCGPELSRLGTDCEVTNCRGSKLTYLNVILSLSAQNGVVDLPKVRWARVTSITAVLISKIVVATESFALL